MSWNKLLERNSRWAEARKQEDPEYFARMAASHRPRAYFIGCSDARVPGNLLTDSDVGELFVHRNIANQVHTTDASLGAGLQYAIEVLGVEDVIVCGHHGCGGVRAALGGDAPPQVEAWISPLRLLARLHHAELMDLDEEAQVNCLAALNVAEQVAVLARHPSVRGTWARGRALRLHGWIYDLPSGLLVPRLRIEGEGEGAVHLLGDIERSAMLPLSSPVVAQAK